MASVYVIFFVTLIAITNGKSVRYRETLVDDLIESINLLDEEADSNKVQYTADDPLSDDFIESINNMNSTWRVSKTMRF